MIFGKRRSFSRDTLRLNIPKKSAYVMRLIFFAMLVLLGKIWLLAVVEHEARQAEARAPQVRKTILQPERGTIRDRFGLPLALNRVQYNVAVRYSEIRQIPRIKWITNRQGKRIKTYPRKEHVEKLVKMLGGVLERDWEEIEDEIYSKAALFQHLPYTLQTDIPESTYFRLKLLEKDFKGLVAECSSKRFYPQGRIGGELVGYMGAISAREYQEILDEMRQLSHFIEENQFEGGEALLVAKERLNELEEMAYSRTDAIGKTGLEEAFEEDLRGTYGYSFYEANAKGGFLNELPGGVQSAAGKGVKLALSAELQNYAELLLAKNEEIREGRSRKKDPDTGKIIELNQPWIKGGAIVVMDPHTGEILTLASYPRINPNDFIVAGSLKNRRQKLSNVKKWLELEGHIGEVWDQKRSLERERVDFTTSTFYEEHKDLTWPSYLDAILPKNNPISSRLKTFKIKDAVKLLRTFEGLLALSGQESVLELVNVLYPKTPYRSKLSDSDRDQILLHLQSSPQTFSKFRKVERRFLNYFKHNYDRLLFLDLCRIACNTNHFSEPLLQKVGNYSLEEYRKLECEVLLLKQKLEKQLFSFHRDYAFAPWREENQKAFLKEKRREERLNKTYQRPYLDYLRKEERRQWNALRETHQWEWLAYALKGGQGGQDPYLLQIEPQKKEPFDTLSFPLAKELVQTFRSFSERTKPLWGKYSQIRSEKGMQLEKHLAGAFYPLYGFGYGRSQAYRQSAPQGSVFKVVTAYQGLIEYYRRQVESHSLTASLNPLEIIDRSEKIPGKGWSVGYTASGKRIPQFYKGGNITKSLIPNIGKIDLVRALETSSNVYFALLAADILEYPEKLNEAAKHFGYGTKTGIELPGEISGKLPTDLSSNQTGLYAATIGQHSLVVTPLQTAMMLATFANEGKMIYPRLVNDGTSTTASKWEVWMPPMVRQPILEAMARIAYKKQTTQAWNISRYFQQDPQAMRDLVDLKGYLIGKSGTAEAIEVIGLDREKGRERYNHIWFGGIVLKHPTRPPHKKIGQGELVVVVYLKYAGYGKETFPVAAQIVKKWKEIQRRNVLKASNS